MRDTMRLSGGGIGIGPVDAILFPDLVLYPVTAVERSFGIFPTRIVAANNSPVSVIELDRVVSCEFVEIQSTFFLDGVFI
jgi:hypothetical protein